MNFLGWISSAVLISGSIMAQFAAAAESITVRDGFGRDLRDQTIPLIDWEGPIANPALKLVLALEPSLHFPVKVSLTCESTRIEFNLPSSVGKSGAAKSLTFEKADPQLFWISNISVREPKTLKTILKLEVTDADGKSSRTQMPIEVTSREPTDLPRKYFKVILDYDQDESGFFKKNEKARALIQSATNDWVYYLNEMTLDRTPARSEKSSIWAPDGFKTGKIVTNVRTYRGFHLYVTGIHNTELRSGGNGSHEGKEQTSAGALQGMKRSGTLAMETQGNFNELGWFYSEGDADWWVSGNLREEKNDFYSIAHHELGHALFFDDAHPRFKSQKTTGVVSNDKVLKYLGKAPAVSAVNHFDGTVDPVSLRGAFGNELGGSMPPRRWTMTKLDLLMAESIGYSIRPSSIFEPLEIGRGILPEGNVGKAYVGKVTPSGGIPYYQWIIGAGELPPGITIDSFTGQLTGTPTQNGLFRFTLRVRDSDPTSRPAEKDLSIRIGTVSAT